MPENGEAERGPRGLWSGTLSFGLVSVPVSLFTANRPGRPSLRMVDDEGTPLARRYFCGKDDRALERDDIVRGFAVEKDRYVVIEDDELESIAPEKSSEIDLERFVPAADIDPAYFRRAYFLAPGKGGSRPYRLLAKAMEDSGRAGIATFVMHAKEYLVAIIAERGILRAETLRFHDELRTPDDVGLTALPKPDAKAVRAAEKAIRALQAGAPDEAALADGYTKRLEALVKRKLKAGDDVVGAPGDAEPSDRESADVIDLMQVLKERLRGRAGGTAGTRVPKQAGKLDQRSKAELYERAKSLDIGGRSAMSKAQLIDAIRDAS